MARFPFPRFPGSGQPRPRRRYPRRVGLIGALALLIAAIAGGVNQCGHQPAANQPTSGQRPAASGQQPAASSQQPAPSAQQPAASAQQPAAPGAAKRAPNDLSGRVSAPAAPPAQWQALDGAPITAADEVRGIWETLRRVAAGPPYPYRQDGESFSNRERRLPQRERGWWREFTVETPGSPDRGARRLVIGQDGEAWYTADHYRTFVRLVVP